MPSSCPRDPNMQCLVPGPTPEGGCCKVIPANRPVSFSVGYRNPGHWDITTRYGRAFRIRGAGRDVVVHDERTDDARPFPRGSIPFTSVAVALAWCADALMQEPTT